MFDLVHTSHCGSRVSQRVSGKISLTHVIACLRVCCFLALSSFSLSLSRPYFLSHWLPVLCPAHQLPCGRNRRGIKPLHSRNEEYCPGAMHGPLTSYEPELLDNFDNSGTSAMIFQDESGDIGTEPSYLCDVELDDETIGKALSSPLIIQEREEPADLRQACPSHEESLLPAQSFFAHTSTGRPAYEPSSSQKRKSGRDMENERIRIPLERQKRANSRWSQNWDPEARTSSRVWYKKYPGINWNYWFSAKGNWSYYHKWWTMQARSITTSRTSIRKTRDLCEAHIKSSHEMEELKRVKELRVDEFSRTLLNSWPEFRNYKMKSIVWISREILTMLNQYAVDNATFPVNWRYFQLIVFLVEC